MPTDPDVLRRDIENLKIKRQDLDERLRLHRQNIQDYDDLTRSLNTEKQAESIAQFERRLTANGEALKLEEAALERAGVDLLTKKVEEIDDRMGRARSEEAEKSGEEKAVEEKALEEKVVEEKAVEKKAVQEQAGKRRGNGETVLSHLLRSVHYIEDTI